MSRKLTNWAKHVEKRPSLLWLIEHAPTLGMLEEFLAMAVQAKDADAGTRRRWLEAAERTQFILERRPPVFEKIGVAEAFGEVTDPRLKMSVADAVQQVIDNRHFALAEMGVFEFAGLFGPESLAKHFKRWGGWPLAPAPAPERCPGCDGRGYIVKPGAMFDPPEQEPCPVCGL